MNFNGIGSIRGGGGAVGGGGGAGGATYVGAGGGGGAGLVPNRNGFRAVPGSSATGSSFPSSTGTMAVDCAVPVLAPPAGRAGELDVAAGAAAGTVAGALAGAPLLK